MSAGAEGEGAVGTRLLRESGARVGSAGGFGGGAPRPSPGGALLQVRGHRLWAWSRVAGELRGGPLRLAEKFLVFPHGGSSGP